MARLPGGCSALSAVWQAAWIDMSGADAARFAQIWEPPTHALAYGSTIAWRSSRMRRRVAKAAPAWQEPSRDPRAQGTRTTPSVVAFSDTERLIGDGALNQAAMNAKNTIFEARPLRN